MDKVNILVCDDDKEIVDAIEIYLQQEGSAFLSSPAERSFWRKCAGWINTDGAAMSCLTRPRLMCGGSTPRRKNKHIPRARRANRRTRG